MFGNNQVNQTPLQSSILNQFYSIMRGLTNQRKIDNNINNTITQIFHSNLSNFENAITSRYSNGISLTDLDTIIKNSINDIYTKIINNQTQSNMNSNMMRPNMMQSNMMQPNMMQPNMNNGLYDTNVGINNPMSNYDVGVGNTNQNRNDIFDTNNRSGNQNSDIDIPFLQKQNNQTQNRNTTSAFTMKSKLSQLNIKTDKTLYKTDDSYYNSIDLIQHNNDNPITVLSGKIDNKNKFSIKSTISINDNNDDKTIIVDNDKKVINIKYDNIKDIKLCSCSNHEIVKIIRSYNQILYPWNNSVCQLYSIYKSLLDDTDLSIFSKCKDMQIKNKIKLNIIYYNEYIPSSESLKLALENFKIIEDNIIKPFYVKSNVNYFIDFINHLLENNIRLYNKQSFFDYGQLENIDDIQEMIIDYNNPQIEFDKNNLFIYYINKIKELFYQNNSTNKKDISYFIKNKKCIIIDNDNIDYYNTNTDFIIEIPNNYRDLIIKDIFLSNRDIFEIDYVKKFSCYKITPIFIDKEFSDVVLYYQKH